ncbi:MAG: hypothetical protein K0R66_1722 [Gammaproteobacteria bacterium]|jgi:hypothetical protein|nr:hypothetical protein [Gammaproteobacteria bacterium]
MSNKCYKTDCNSEIIEYLSLKGYGLPLCENHADELEAIIDNWLNEPAK